MQIRAQRNNSPQLLTTLNEILVAGNAKSIKH